MRAFPLLLTSCITATAVPTAMHPTASASEQSVSAALGGAYATGENNSLIVIPHAEGWIRHPVGPGQISTHLGANVAHVGYRYDVLHLTDGFGLAIEPFLGGSYYRYESKPNNPMDPTQTQSLLSFSIGIAPTFLIAAGPNFVYAVPKFGFQLIDNLEAMPGTDNTSSLYMLGLALGIDIGGGLSIEIGGHRIQSTENNASPEWLIVPTLGVRH